MEIARRIEASPRTMWGPDPEVVLREALSLNRETVARGMGPRSWEHDTSITYVVTRALASVRRRRAA